MIEAQDYKLPTPKQPKPKPNNADPETLAYLESLPWQPFDVEW